ncbi:carboxylate--amine ligase [Geomonas paludis]|uniref:ATP-grasp domain-containing protein n=1 Tax=Geomonas paludis TaxID=2740185 RepID=A0A6V8MVU5_9BACT|nr:ATP-grasp domain-containing protein [Geomonas paludis]GFO63693.1 hypothetical protein GMPD_16120 [Geomonas paludis]
MNVLVTDGENRSALAIVRSLGSRGVKVIVTGTKISCLSSRSKFCSRYRVVTDPMERGEDYLGDIIKVIKDENVEIVFPVTEQTIFWLNKGRNLCMDTIIASPSEEQMDSICNKSSLMELARSLGVETPFTINVRDEKDLVTKLPELPSYPLVVKPAYSKTFIDGRLVPSSVMYASNEEELLSLYRTCDVLKSPSLIQELILGEGTGIFTLFDKDHHLALFSHRRLLEKPPSGGVSVLSESVPLDPTMVDSATRLLSAVGWTGVAMVEFKKDQSGQAKLMEINGRFWGSLQLAVSCGVDFPYLAFCYYSRQNLPYLEHPYLLGHKLKWSYGILDHCLIRAKQAFQVKSYRTALPSFMQVLEAFFASGPTVSSDVFRAEDMGPFMQETLDYFNSFLGRKV